MPDQISHSDDDCLEFLLFLRTESLSTADLYRDRIHGLLSKATFFELHGFTEQPGGHIEGQISSIGVPKKVLSPSHRCAKSWGRRVRTDIDFAVYRNLQCHSE